jgi:hypothetical protein
VAKGFPQCGPASAAGVDQSPVNVEENSSHPAIVAAPGRPRKRCGASVVISIASEDDCVPLARPVPFRSHELWADRALQRQLEALGWHRQEPVAHIDEAQMVFLPLRRTQTLRRKASS